MLMDLEVNRPGSAVTVACRDVARRQREVVVTRLLDEQVMVTLPPGELARFAPTEAEKLRAALHAATTGAMVETAPALTVGGFFSCTVPCSDAIGRDRAVTIMVDRSCRVVMAGPPGGVAIVRPGRARLWCIALHAAIGAADIGAAIA